MGAQPHASMRMREVEEDAHVACRACNMMKDIKIASVSYTSRSDMYQAFYSILPNFFLVGNIYLLAYLLVAPARASF